MRICQRFLFAVISMLPVFVPAQDKLKLENNRLVVGETLNYKATWGFVTIGSAYTKIDKTIYKIGSNYCYSVEVNGQTNGLAKLFFLHDKWQSYIDTATITTHKSFRSIREGRYQLDEIVHFDHLNQKAEVQVLDKKTHAYVFKKKYDTPGNIRDIITGALIFRLIDFEKYAKGDTIVVNGFYEDEAYKIEVVYVGPEYIKTDKGRIRCYKVTPILPNNKVFNGRKSVDIWFAANKSQAIVRIIAKLFLGNIHIELQD